MKRWILYGLLIAFLGWTPVQGVDIGELSPVQTVWLSECDGQVYLQTDGGDFGQGENIEAALTDLQRSAIKMVFLKTADYLIIEKGKEELLGQVTSVFRPTCAICVSETMPDLENATAFLRNHEPTTTLRQWRVEQNFLPVLREQKGRFCWLDG